MELTALLQSGMPVLVIGMLVVLERIHSKVNDIQEDVRDIKQSITWKDTCNERHDEVGRRLANLERNAKLNGNR